MKTFVVFSCLIFVSACFNRDESSTTPVQKPPVISMAILQEFSKMGKIAGELDVVFMKKANEPKKVVQRVSQATGRAPIGTQCDVITKAPTRAGVEYISGGKIEFSPINEMTSLEVTEDLNHLYHKTIEGSLPDGYYQIIGSGNEIVPSFKTHLSMPGRLEEPRINGTSFSDEMGAIKKSEEMALEWRRPSFGTEGNILVMNFIGISQKNETVQVECAALERELDNGENTLKWNLPKVFIQQLPTTAVARLFFSRAHIVRPDKLQNLEADLQGFRTSVIDMLIGE